MSITRDKVLSVVLLLVAILVVTSNTCLGVVIPPTAHLTEDPLYFLRTGFETPSQAFCNNQLFRRTAYYRVQLFAPVVARSGDVSMLNKAALERALLFSSVI